MPASRPDVVLFMMDQLSARWLEGASGAATPAPNLDRLRAMGTSFSRAFTSNPLCMPARSTLATGLTTRGHGVLQNGHQLDPALTTHMQLLQQAGWRTGAFGKVHFRPHFAGVYPDYRPYGFDVQHITEDARAGEWLDWVREAHPEHFEAALATIWPTAIPELSAYGPDRENLAERIRTVRKSFDWRTDAFPGNTGGAYTLPFPEQVSQTAWIARHALGFLRDTPGDQPLYAHVSFVQPHSPFCPPEGYMARVDVARLTPPAPVEWLDDPLHPQCFDRRGEGGRVIPPRWREVRHYYFADVCHLDSKLGLVLDALEATGRLGDTLVVLLADHGELLFDHACRGKGEFHYDACIRVPLIVAGPGLQRGATCDAIVQLEDVLPTILEATGVAYPTPEVLGPYLKHEPETLPGRSLLPWCRGERPEGWRDAAYVESYNNINSVSPIHWARTLRTADWRYTLYPGGSGEQLFPVADDPEEQHNLAGDPGYAAVRRDLRDRLLELIILQDYPHSPREVFSLGVH